MYCVRIEKTFYDMQGLHFTSNNHFLGSLLENVLHESKEGNPRRRKTGKTGHSWWQRQRGRPAWWWRAPRHDSGGGPSRTGKGAPAGLWSGQLQLGINKDSERGVNRETINLTNYHCIWLCWKAFQTSVGNLGAKFIKEHRKQSTIF